MIGKVVETRMARRIEKDTGNAINLKVNDSTNKQEGGNYTPTYHVG